MAIQLTQTGNVKSDITSVINELNNLSNGTNNISSLNIVAYGQMSITVPDQQFGVFSNSFHHGLGYKPIFIVYEQASTSNGPFQPQIEFAELGPFNSYYYFTGPQSIGSYFYSWDFAYVDTQNLYIDFKVISNAGPFYSPGIYNYLYYIFSYPIT